MLLLLCVIFSTIIHEDIIWAEFRWHKCEDILGTVGRVQKAQIRGYKWGRVQKAKSTRINWQSSEGTHGPHLTGAPAEPGAPGLAEPLRPPLNNQQFPHS